MRLERIPEEDQAVNFTIGDSCADLLVSAERPTLKFVHVEAELLLEHVTGRAGRAQRMRHQDFAIEAGPLQQFLFLVVVRNQRDCAHEVRC